MSILNVEHLSHGFGDRAIFQDVSFRLLKGEHIGLVGANGEGKSTFFKIVTDRMMPDEGKIEWAKNVRVGYLDQHAELTGIDIYKESFAGWVKEELGLADEGQTLFDLLAAKKDMAEFTDTVLKMVSYLDEEQSRRVLARIKAYEDKSLFEQEILKADRFLMSGKYKSSIRAYEPLTEHVPENRREEVLLGRVWHNMGTAYARLFMFARAGECYEKAYAKNEEQESAEAALLSRACLEEDFKKEPQDKKFLEQWQKIQETKKNGDVRGYEALLFEMMEQWKQEYRKAAEDR